MRLGCCGAIEQISLCKDAGFDFLEVGIQPVLQGLVDDNTWAAQAPNPDKLALPIEAANSLLPASLPVVGNQRDLSAIKQYMKRVAKRASHLGIKILVFGSGKARKRGDDVNEQTALKHLVEFCNIAGDACVDNGVTLVVEHLNRSETNTINTLGEEKALIEQTNSSAVTALVDSYHYGLEGDSDQAMLDLGNLIDHVHVAEVKDRRQPGAHGDSAEAYDFVHFFKLLRQLNYDKRISIEARWDGEIDKHRLVNSAKFLRAAWDKTK